MDLLSCSQLSSITYTRHMSCFLCELLNFFFVFFFRSFCSACVSLENSARQETTKKSRKINKQNVTVWIVAVSMRFSFIKLEEEERILASFLFTLSHAEGERKFGMMKFFSYFFIFLPKKKISRDEQLFHFSFNSQLSPLLTPSTSCPHLSHRHHHHLASTPKLHNETARAKTSHNFLTTFASPLLSRQPTPPLNYSGSPGCARRRAGVRTLFR